MSATKLKLAVVGHTNVGKTSLMRTLLRDVEFGEISDRPGTTRSIDSATITAAPGAPGHITLFDTPGLEDSIGLLEHLESIRGSGVDGYEAIQRFLESDEAARNFTQEAKALRQVLECDAALYVIDARERILAKYRDELRILGYCARPVVPVLNFVASERARVNEWRAQLARVNMHAVAEFDTVVLEINGEIRLYEKIRTLLDRFQPVIDSLIESRRRERRELRSASARLVAEMLVDVAAYSVTLSASDADREDEIAAQLKDTVRRRESRCVAQLLDLHRFRADDYVPGDWPIESGKWNVDLFSPAAAQEYAIGGGGGAAAGAMVGLTLDVMLHGLSLGAATALGAAIGGALGAGKRPGRRLIEKLSGRVSLRVERVTLELLAARALALIRALFRRGHADVNPLRPPDRDEGAAHRQLAPIVRPLTSAVGRRSWSRIDSGARPMIPDPRRERLIDTIAARIEEQLDGDMTG